MTYIDGIVKRIVSIDDPVERMKWIPLIMVIPVHELGDRTMKQPLNPILGETYVGKTSINS